MTKKEVKRFEQAGKTVVGGTCSQLFFNLTDIPDLEYKYQDPIGWARFNVGSVQALKTISTTGVAMRFNKKTGYLYTNKYI